MAARAGVMAARAGNGEKQGLGHCLKGTCGAHSRTCGPCCKTLFALFYVLGPLIFLKSVFAIFKLSINSCEVK